ncbi:adenosylcobinamide-phosphate synthase CbiB [Noviherbaspirillum sp. CPCC 100848]|uniref:Cobalamin biosynthesis protein CobD n=1 Tax=Noviherbaspirillum album TaxID=3080276 RepID=A0ABU6JEU7_9BURK|nr:adenosylcobinamide-phosphate synthase CbiB [Noviherbaspirillum sp. CPCC 100848]MEC4722177.1 adenosylcobinamide-phosphate synthase CbiB [Noviherbaspirillum sp. CPCC 100848]
MLSGLTLSAVALLMLAGVVLDWLLGEPRRFHPLVGFGRIAGLIEQQCNRGGAGVSSYLRGVIGWVLAVLPLVVLTGAALHAATQAHSLLGMALHALLLYFCIGLRSLRDHMLPIAAALAAGQLGLARELTSRIVSRDTARANDSDLAKAAVESTLENGNDAVFGTLFWFAVAGGPGALLFRLANTLDAMWGYRNARFLRYGWMAARTDDALNWIPARLTALSYMLLGDGRRARQCWRTQAAAWPSPNAGPVMSSGAGALGLALGGTAEYDGAVETRPPLGTGRPAEADDIGRAWRLVGRTTLLWIAVLGCLAILNERMPHA